MNRFLILILVWLILPETGLVAQNNTTASESRKAHLKKILDYRYRGGYYTFEKDFNITVNYPEAARQNCIIGIIILSLEVGCDGEIKQIALKNPLKYGIDEEVSNFINGTSGRWNKCEDDRYTRMEIPVQFTMKGTQTNANDGLLVKEGKNPGFVCNGDDYYLEKAEKALSKKKGKKALPLLDILIKRDPYNVRLYEMKKEALSYLE